MLKLKFTWWQAQSFATQGGRPNQKRGKATTFVKQTVLFVSFWTLCLFATTHGMPPEMEVPSAPQVPALKAIKLVEDFLAKRFPKDNSLYCQSANLVDVAMAPVGGERHWDLVYRHAGAERKSDPQNGKDSFNDIHVYVTMAGVVSLEWPVKEKRE